MIRIVAAKIGGILRGQACLWYNGGKQSTEDFHQPGKTYKIRISKSLHAGINGMEQISKIHSREFYSIFFTSSM